MSLSERSTGLLRKTGEATIGALIGQGPGVLVAPVAAFVLGANQQTDAAFLALTLATLVTNALSGATQFAAVPFLVASPAGTTSASYLASLTRLVAAVGTMVAFAIALAANQFSVLLGSDHELAARFFWWMVPFIVTVGITSLFTGALNARHDYWNAAIAPLCRWLTILMSVLLLGPTVGVTSLLAGYATGEALRLWFLTPRIAREFGPVPWFEKFSIVEPFLMPFIRSGAAQVPASIALAMVPLIDRRMAASLAAGSISLLEYADRLWQVPVGFAMSGLLVVVLSDWSREFQRNANVETIVAQSQRASMLLGLVAVIPSALLVWHRQFVVELLFGRSSLTAASLPVLADTLGCFIAGIPAYLVALTFTRALIVLRRSDRILLVAVVMLVLKIALNVALIRFGVAGIAAGTGIMYAAAALLLWWFLHDARSQSRRDIALGRMS